MKRPDTPETDCPNCDGRGVVPATGTGVMLRREREEADLSRRELARYVVGMKYTYLWDLENDTRKWSWDQIERYREAIRAAVKARLEEAA